MGRSGPIGLITKRKQSVVAPFDKRKHRANSFIGNKENGAAGTTLQQQSVATRRFAKAHQKAVRKEIKLISEAFVNAKSEERLGLLSRKNSQILVKMPPQSSLTSNFDAPQRRNTIKQQKKGFLGRKRSFNELQKTQTM